MQNVTETIGQVVLLAVLLFGLLVVATDQLPAVPEQEQTCTCSGKADCETAVFDTDGTGERLVRCALWGERETCCQVPQ